MTTICVPVIHLDPDEDENEDAEDNDNEDADNVDDDNDNAADDNDNRAHHLRPSRTPRS